MLNLEDLPKRISLSRVAAEDRSYRRGRAVQRSCWRRLRRFLRQRVGRPWREVQAELDQRIRNLPVAASLRDELRRRVHRDLFGSRLEWRWLSTPDGQLVVDDETGLLTFQPRSPRLLPVSYGIEELRTEPERIR